MPCVNYVREHMTFIEHAQDIGLSGNEQLLWYALVHILNQRSIGSNWPDGYIRIANKRLLALLPIGFDAMAKARNGLMQAGLLEYKKGRKNSECPMYRLRYLTCPDYPQVHDPDEDEDDQPVDNLGKTSFYPFLTDKTQGKNDFYPFLADKTQGKTGGKTQGKTANNNKLNLNLNETDMCEEEDEEEEEYAREDSVMQRNVNAVHSALQDHYGRDALPAEARRIALMATNLHLEPDLIDTAIEQAALAHAQNVFAYCATLFSEWSHEDIQTAEEFGQYKYMKDVRDGRQEGGGWDPSAEMEEAREARRKRHREES